VPSGWRAFWLSTLPRRRCCPGPCSRSGAWPHHSSRHVTCGNCEAHVVVIGPVFSGLLPRHACSKLEKAQALNEAGAHIQVITEEEFLTVMGGGLPEANALEIEDDGD
jgi:hypothetical protein